MFTPEEREQIRSAIIEVAQMDSRISGGAITGSASTGHLDRWSDIDLAFGVREASDVPAILKGFTERMYGDYKALHHLDVLSGPWIYRVFFLANTLQVDLAFVQHAEFGARASTFKLVFGSENQIPQISPTPSDTLVGWCWLYALHVRSSIKREKVWQAEHFISAMRDQVIALACLRHNLPEKQARGVDRLPMDVKKKLEDGLVRSLHVKELKRAFGSIVVSFIEELYFCNEGMGSRLGPALKELLN